MWMRVPPKNGGGLSIGLSIGDIMQYVSKNARKHWPKGVEARRIARQTWTEWIASHRTAILESRARLGEGVVENSPEGPTAPVEDAGMGSAPENPVAPQPVPAAGEHVLQLREISSQDIDPSLVDLLYEDDAGRIIHPLNWREGFGIYGPDHPLPSPTSPHRYPMRAMPTDRYTMSTISDVEPHPEPPLYPATSGIVTIEATVARGYETPIRYHMLACARAWGFGIDLTVHYPMPDHGHVPVVARVVAPWERNILSGMETMEGLLTLRIYWTSA